ncbi:MAG: hypothetical protein FJ196_04905 [Gammaproteobacteria bacterium]|nr:hypothetical protein [Gammaproteobacteria bacterium]
MRAIDESLRAALATLLEPYGLVIKLIAEGMIIPGSYWGEREAGLVGPQLFIRPDTPLHSALHEAAHFVCMNEARRKGLECDAGGDAFEENAVCYLQILWSDCLPGIDAETIMSDMDEWGYTFRLGSAAGWFRKDADDARQWLQTRGLLDECGVLRRGQRVA